MFLLTRELDDITCTCTLITYKCEEGLHTFILKLFNLFLYTVRYGTVKYYSGDENMSRHVTFIHFKFFILCGYEGGGELRELNNEGLY